MIVYHYRNLGNLVSTSFDLDVSALCNSVQHDRCIWLLKVEDDFWCLFFFSLQGKHTNDYHTNIVHLIEYENIMCYGSEEEGLGVPNLWITSINLILIGSFFVCWFWTFTIKRVQFFQIQKHPCSRGDSNPWLLKRLASLRPYDYWDRPGTLNLRNMI